MGQFAIRTDVVTQLAERERTLVLEFTSIEKDLSGILTKMTQSGVISSSVRNKTKNILDDVSEYGNIMNKMAITLEECTAEYQQTEKKLMLLRLQQTWMENGISNTIANIVNTTMSLVQGDTSTLDKFKEYLHTIIPSEVKEFLEEDLIDSSIVNIFAGVLGATSQRKESLSEKSEDEWIVWNDVSTKPSNALLHVIKEELASIPEDAKTAGEALAWIEEQYGNLPHWFTHGVDIAVVDLFVPSSLQTAYTLTSNILQGDLTLEEGWGAVTSILKKNTKLAVICETINYTFDKGTAREEEMKQEVLQQITEGDVLGAVFDTAEGFVDTIIGGTIEVSGDIGGGAVDTFIDNIPVVKGINMLTEYGTGLLGWNDGDGYSLGGLIGAGTEKISDGLDIVTDFITDKVDIVTDAVTDTVKTGINWVKGWFD